MSNQTKNKKEVKKSLEKNDLIISIFKGSSIGFIILIISFALIAMYNVKADKAISVKIISLLLCAFASFVCGFISAIKTKYKAMLIGFLSSLLFMAYLFISLLIASKGTMSVHSLILIPICLMSSIIGSILKKNMKHRK